jgi:hypothetical protein
VDAGVLAAAVQQRAPAGRWTAQSRRWLTVPN